MRQQTVVELLCLVTRQGDRGLERTNKCLNAQIKLWITIVYHSRYHREAGYELCFEGLSLGRAPKPDLTKRTEI